jgi:predicted protein tyrosine phosphatase
MNLLFVCNQGRHRSRTAADMLSGNLSTRAVGLFSERPLAESDLSWADLVIVMEDFQRTEISKRFPKQYLQKQIVCIDIPDMYSYGDPALKTLLRQRMLSVEPL